MLHAHGEAHIDLANEVAGVKPAIALFLNVTDNLTGGGLGVGITVKFGLGIDLSQQQTGLSHWHFDAATGAVAHNLIVFVVVFHQCNLADRRANRFVFIEQIEKGDIALAGTINFTNALHVEATLELVPDVGPQAIAHHFLQRIIFLLGTFRLHGKVAAQLPHIDKTISFASLYLRPKI